MKIFKLVMKCLLALLFISFGILHFAIRAVFESIMPPYLPWHLELVYLSGVFEITLGMLLLVPRFSVLAGWGLIALLIAVFPANIHMALHPEEYPQFGPDLLWARLPFQPILIAWAFWFTRHKKRDGSNDIRVGG